MSFHEAFRQRIDGAPGNEALAPLVDMHVHLVDFIQKTDGMRALLETMGKARVQRAVVSGLSVRKKWEHSEPEQPHYYLDDSARCYYYTSTDEIVASEYLRLGEAERGRIAPMLCGFNPTDRLAIDYVDSMFGKYPFWRGIGELLLRHDDLSSLINDESARINHPALFDVFGFCADKGIPALVHHNSTSVWHHDRYEYVGELKETLERFPRTTFVWAHCGCSRRILHKRYYEMVAEMLRAHRNLYVDYSWVVYDDIICDGHVPKTRWLELTLAYPDRIMLGSDLCGHFDRLGKTVSRYNPLLERLPERERRMVARENAERLWFA